MGHRRQGHHRADDLVRRRWIDIATAIHCYETILATLAIVIWHVYHVIFEHGLEVKEKESGSVA